MYIYVCVCYIYKPFEHLGGLIHWIVSPDNGAKSTKHSLQNILQFLHSVWAHLEERGRGGGGERGREGRREGEEEREGGREREREGGRDGGREGGIMGEHSNTQYR